MGTVKRYFRLHRHTMPMYKMLPEKRRGERVSVDLEASYRSEAIAMEGRVANLSRNGLFLESDILDDEGSVVAIDLELPGHDEALQLRGEVVRVDMRPAFAGMGIRFVDLPPASQRALANYMISANCQARG